MVVGIIVALAAVIVPSVVVFSGKGDEGAKAAESETIQTAMDTLLADEGITSVTGISSGGTATQVWTALPANPGLNNKFLANYLRENTTSFFYCYDGTGKVTQQAATAITCS